MPGSPVNFFPYLSQAATKVDRRRFIRRVVRRGAWQAPHRPAGSRRSWHHTTAGRRALRSMSIPWLREMVSYFIRFRISWKSRPWTSAPLSDVFVHVEAPLPEDLQEPLRAMGFETPLPVGSSEPLLP